MAERIRVRFALGLCVTAVAIVSVGGVSPARAHNGYSLPAPSKANPMITVDGSAGEPAWTAGASAGPSPNTCDELLAMTGRTVVVRALKDASNLYLALTIPDDHPAADDEVFLFFDSNHAAGAALEGDDVAYALLLGDTSGSNLSPVGAKKYKPAAMGWDGGAALPPAVAAKHTRAADGIVVEMKIPFTELPGAVAPATSAVGFAFVYLNRTTLDCDNTAVADVFKVVWPTSLSNALSGPSYTLPGDLKVPAQWGDLGRDLATVGFKPPVRYFSTDITFPGPIVDGIPVPIEAEVHSRDALTSGRIAHDVNVEIRVHDFGVATTPAVFTGPIAVIPAIGAGAKATTAPVTWPSPQGGLHGCIQAEIKPPSSGTPDYAIEAGLELAQHNADVAKVAKSERSRMTFTVFNPDKIHERRISLVKVERIPERMRGLSLELVQPNRPLRPLEKFEAALVIGAPARLPVTDVPRQHARVPPTAGGAIRKPGEGGPGNRADTRNLDPVRIAAKPGDRLHVVASGEVDVDGGGPLPSAGPDGRDMSNDIAQGEFLLAAAAARRYGGALIGSFDGFATSFVVGHEATVMIPQNREGLWLAVNDLVGRHADNGGKGFDVEAWTLPGSAGGGRNTIAEVDVVALTTQQVTAGDRVHNVVTALGGVTYQVLVTEAAAGTAPPAPPASKLWLWLLLLSILVIALILALRKKKAA